MARASKTDPLRNFKFQVNIVPMGAALSTAVGSIGNLGFAVVSGLSTTNEVIMYREGGMNTNPHKMIGQSDWAPVTFSKGVYAQEDNLYNWQTFLNSWNQGGIGGGSTSADNNYRCDIIVSVFDHPVSNGSYATPGDTTNSPTPAGDRKLAFKLHSAWPASWSMTDLNAGDSSILIQQLVVNHEGASVFFADSVDGAAPYPPATS